MSTKKSPPPPTDPERAALIRALQEDLDDLGPRRRGGWVRLPVDVWDSVWPQLARPWTEEQVAFDLRWQQDQFGKLLSRTLLARRYGWTRDEVRTPIRRTAEWWDPSWGDAPTERPGTPRGAPPRVRAQADPVVPSGAQADPPSTGEPVESANRDPVVPSGAQADPAVPQRVDPPPPPPPPPPEEEQRSALLAPDGRQLDMLGPRATVKRRRKGSNPDEPAEELTERKLILMARSAFQEAYQAHYGQDKLYAFVSPGHDTARLKAWASTFELRKEPDRGAARIWAAALAYFDAVDHRKAFPYGEPPTTRWFTEGLGKWAAMGDRRLKPRPVEEPDPTGGGPGRIDRQTTPPPDLTEAERAQIAREIDADGSDLLELITDPELREQLRTEQHNEIAWKIRGRRP